MGGAAVIAAYLIMLGGTSEWVRVTLIRDKPLIVLKAAAMLGLQPSECLVVDDAHSGIEAALAGGFDCAATGYAKQDERAKFHLSQLSDLVS